MEGDELNRAEWENEENWTFPGFYYSKADTRWLVPKRNPRMGWTFNLGQKKGLAAMITMILLPVIILVSVALFVIVKAAK